MQSQKKQHWLFSITLLFSVGMFLLTACGNNEVPSNAKVVQPVVKNDVTPQTGNPNGLKDSYALPLWWRPCLDPNNPANYITRTIDGKSHKICIKWDMSKPPAHCDSVNYKTFTGVDAVLIRSWKGFDVCGPLPLQVSSDDNYVQFGPTGRTIEQENECTALVKMYLQIAYGLPSLPASGSGVVDSYTTISGSPFHKVINDAEHNKNKMIPIEGDVLSYGPSAQNSFGHTSIVTNSSIQDGIVSIDVIEQNIGKSGHATLTMKNGVILPDANHFGHVSSWMTTRPVPAVLGASTQKTPAPSVTPKPNVPSPVATDKPTQPVKPTVVPTQIPTPEPTKVPTPKQDKVSKPSGNSANVGSLPVAVPPNGAIGLTANAVVNGSMQWNSTRLAVSVGQVFTVAATGSMVIAQSDPGKTPAGDTSCIADNSYTAPTLHCWSLIGQIGNGSIFEIGAGGTFKSTSNGVLSFSVNDNDYSDNVGDWNATITEYSTTASVTPTVTPSVITTPTPDITPTPTPSPTTVPTEIPTQTPIPTTIPTVEHTPIPVAPTPTPTPESGSGKHKKH